MKKDLRHRAREAALQILYQWEIGQTDVPRGHGHVLLAAVARRGAAP